MLCPHQMPKESTNPIGPGTVNLGINIPEWLWQDLMALAGKSGLKLTPYLRTVLIEVARNGLLAEHLPDFRDREKAFATIRVHSDLSSEALLSERRRAMLKQRSSQTVQSPGGPAGQHPGAVAKPGGGIGQRSDRRRTTQKKNQQ